MVSLRYLPIFGQLSIPFFEEWQSLCGPALYSLKFSFPNILYLFRAFDIFWGARAKNIHQQIQQPAF